jgi:hypothetical protein
MTDPTTLAAPNCAMRRQRGGPSAQIIREFIRAHTSGGCRWFSLGPDGCQCPLCHLDRALTAADAAGYARGQAEGLREAIGASCDYCRRGVPIDIDNPNHWLHWEGKGSEACGAQHLHQLVQRAEATEAARRDGVVYEDTLPADLPQALYDLLYPHSWVDGVRLFPGWSRQVIEAWEAARREEREACAKVAESEPELEGPMPDEHRELYLADLERALRSTVHITKRNITRAIRARTPTEETGK